MKITVHTGQKERPIQNFWNHIHFHPTDAIEDRWGKAILDRVAEDGTARTVRVYAMLEDIVTRGPDGRLRYDYTLTDRRLDYMVKQGFELLICFNFMPVCLAADPQSMAPLARYKNKHINFSPPRDYREWQEVCRHFAAHILERYGAQTVHNWRLHCWNEPDHLYWLNAGECGVYDEKKLEEYCKLYDHFAAGILSADDKLKIGGPSAAGNQRFVRAFLEHVTGGRNTATGAVGTRLDFLSIHTYGVSPQQMNEGRVPSLNSNLERTILYNKMLTEVGLQGTEILVDEWGAASGGFVGVEKCPGMVFRETAYFPAFYAKMIDKYLAAAAAHQIHLTRMMICLSGQHDLKRDFEGYRNFFTLNGFPKPIYNGYQLAARLGDRLLACRAETDESETGNGAENAGVVATRRRDGGISILLYHLDEDFNAVPTAQKITLTIEGLTGRYLRTHTRIDADHSNAYAEFCRLGRPENPDQLQRETIHEAGAPALLYPQDEVTAQGGYIEEISLPNQAVSLIELRRV